MKNCIIVLILLAVGAVAQQSPRGETRREVVNAAKADDSKANSPEVPEGVAITGRFERVVVFRFKFDTDLLAGLEKMVKQEKIRNGVILAGLGSLRSYHVHQVGNGTFPTKNVFVKNEDGPADIVNVNGYVVDGRVHSHVTLATPEKAFGGHLEPGTRVYTFAIVTVGVLDEKADLSKVDDATWR